MAGFTQNFHTKNELRILVGQYFIYLIYVKIDVRVQYIYIYIYIRVIYFMPWNFVCDPWVSWSFYKTTIIRQLTKWNESKIEKYSQKPLGFCNSMKSRCRRLIGPAEIYTITKIWIILLGFSYIYIYIYICVCVCVSVCVCVCVCVKKNELFKGRFYI